MTQSQFTSMTQILSGCGLVVAGIAQANAAHYSLRPIVIAGASDIAATAINDKGHIVGTYQLSSGLNGFLLKGKNAMTLPQFCNGAGGTCVPLPTAVTKNDQVGGVYSLGPYNNYGFIWKSGSYLPNVNINIGDNNFSLVFLGITESHMVAYNNNNPDPGTFAYSGPASAPTKIPGLGYFGTFAKKHQSNRGSRWFG